MAEPFWIGYSRKLEQEIYLEFSQDGQDKDITELLGSFLNILQHTFWWQGDLTAEHEFDFHKISEKKQLW